MSADTVAGAIEARFEQIGRSELQRLHRKIHALGAPDAAEVARLSREVVAGMATCLGDAVRRHDDPALLRAMVTLFRVAP